MASRAVHGHWRTQIWLKVVPEGFPLYQTNGRTAQPEVLHCIGLTRLADAVMHYLNAQIDAGAQAVQIFDSWGGALAHCEYIEFSLNRMQKIVAGLQALKRWPQHPCDPVHQRWWPVA